MEEGRIGHTQWSDHAQLPLPPKGIRLTFTKHEERGL